MSIMGLGVDALNVENRRFCPVIMDTTLINISLKELIPGRYQPRDSRHINKESLTDLMNSIKEVGILQPIIVRFSPDKLYEIIAGERRYLAAQEIGLSTVPCIIVNVDEKEAFALAIIENIQREQLTPLEESEALLKLKNTHNITVEEVALLIGKPRTTISNMIRVAVYASITAKELCRKGIVEFGHVRAVLSLESRFQDKLLLYIHENKLSVRKAEELVRTGQYKDILNPKQVVPALKTVQVADHIIKKLRNYYKLPVKIKPLAGGKIKIQMIFNDLPALELYLNKIELNEESDG